MNELAIFILVLVIGIFLIRSLRMIGTKPIKSYSKSIFEHYRLDGSILSKSELILYRVINKHFGESHIIGIKIRIADFNSVAKPSARLPKNQAYGLFQRITSKHCDFLISDKSGRPLAWIELDDKSHDTAAARKADKFKDELAAAVKLPLIRIKAGADYNAAMDKVKSSLDISEKI